MRIRRIIVAVATIGAMAGGAAATMATAAPAVVASAGHVKSVKPAYLYNA